MTRRPPQGVDDKLLGEDGAVFLQQKSGVADRLGRRRIRHLHRTGQEVTRKIPFAVAGMGLGHQGQGFGIFGREVEDGAQPRNRDIGAVFLDQARPPAFSVRRPGRDPSTASSTSVRAPATSPSANSMRAKRDPGVSGSARRDPLLIQKRTQRRDRLIRLPQIEQQTRAQDAEAPGLWLGGDDPVQLGHGGLRTSIGEPQLNQRLKRLVTRPRVIGGRVGGLPEKRARKVDLTARDMGLQDHRRQRLILGKQHHHLAQRRENVILALKPGQHLDPDIMKPTIRRIRHEATFQQRKRLFVGALAHQTVDHQPLQEPVVGIVSNSALGLGERGFQGKRVFGLDRIEIGQVDRDHRVAAVSGAS
jgi:hypothetical protein